MKRFNMVLSLVLVLAFLLYFPSESFAQRGGPRPSPKASVSQTVGTDTVITIAFGRPGVKGRKIWGELVPFGLAPGNRYSKDQPFPWRAGANENTTIEFSADVKIEGNDLAAGKYGIHMIPSEKDWVIIFSKDNAGWGSFAYNKDNDALRVTVTPKEAAFQEWMSFGFDGMAGTTATIFLHWEKLQVPFKVEAAK